MKKATANSCGCTHTHTHTHTVNLLDKKCEALQKSNAVCDMQKYEER